MKLTLVQIENMCVEAIDTGFASKLYQSYNGFLAYATFIWLGYGLAHPEEVASFKGDNLAEAFEMVDLSKMPENFEMAKEFFDRQEAQVLQEFYSIRSSINEIKNFDDEEVARTLEQMKQLQETESETLGKLKELI